jgi:hypothetical protein
MSDSELAAMAQELDTAQFVTVVRVAKPVICWAALLPAMPRQLFRGVPPGEYRCDLAESDIERRKTNSKERWRVTRIPVRFAKPLVYWASSKGKWRVAGWPESNYATSAPRITANQIDAYAIARLVGNIARRATYG